MLAALSSLALSACGGGDQQQAETDALPSVEVIAVVQKPFAASTEFIGKTEAFQHVDIRARVTGFLKERAFAEGSEIAENDLLYRIDPAEYEASVASANAGIERAQAALTEAEQKLERTTTLADRGTVSEASRDEATALEGRARADLAAAEADADKAKLDLGYTEIQSPNAGRVGKSNVDVGNLIGPDTGVLATVITLDPIRVVFSLSERTYLNIIQARRSQDLPPITPRIRLANGEVYDEIGEFDFADNQVDPNTGSVRIFAEFPNPDQELLPGQFVNVVITQSKPSDVILIPQAAVQVNQSGAFVLIVDDESAVEARPIRTGERVGAEVVVTEGLTQGETLIVHGIQKVRPGARVNPVPAAMPAS